MAEQFPDNPNDLYYHQVLVIVVNVQAPELNPNPHTRFEEARAIYSAASGHPKAQYFKFIQALPEEVSLSLDLKKNAVGKDLGSANVPGRMVRKQTRDVALVLTKSVNLGTAFFTVLCFMNVLAPMLTSIVRMIVLFMVTFHVFYVTGKYYLFLEDDMEFCRFGLTSFQYLLNKASQYHPDWLGT